MNSISKFIIAFLVSLFTGQVVFAQGEMIYVDADQYKSVSEGRSVLEGHVKVVKGAEILTCDKAFVNQKEQTVDGYGHVVYLASNMFVKAERFSYNFKTQTGIVYDGFIQTKTETIEGTKIVKTGPQNYLGENANFTPCLDCPPAWKVWGSHIDATQGNYAYITNPVVKIANVPVFWLPYMVLPLKNIRQSGFLAPHYTYNETDGFSLFESYFWAINKSSDLTITGITMARRGLKGGVEYRYVPAANSWGKFYGYFLGDKVFGKDERFTKPDPFYTRGAAYATNELYRPNDYQVNRYALKYDHHFELPEGYYNNVKLNYVGDTYYQQDFKGDLPNSYGLPALDNRVSLIKNTENTNTSLDVSYYQDLLKPDPMADNNKAIHRVPSFKFAYSPTSIWGDTLGGGLDIQYLNLARNSASYDGIVNSPSFLYRTGQRFHVRPHLSYPINLFKFLDLLPEASFDSSYYQFGYGGQPTTSRNFARIAISGKTIISTFYGDPTNSFSTKLKHQVEPEIYFTRIPYFDQENHPFFGTQDSILPHYAADQPVTEYRDDPLQFDYYDRVSDKSVITFSVLHKLVKKVYESASDSYSYNEFFRHRISQSYDFAEAKSPYLDRRPWGDLRSSMTIVLPFFTVDSDVRYYQYEKERKFSSVNRVSFGLLGYSFGVTYRDEFSLLRKRTKDPANPYPVTPISGAQQIDYDVSTQFKYIGLTGYGSYAYPSSSYIRWGGTVEYKPPGRCWNAFFTIVKEGTMAKPETSFHLNFVIGENSYGFTPKQYVPSIPSSI